MTYSAMIGSRIRERRVTAGLKQAELARRAGISASYLNLIEHNRRRIGGKTLLKLADVLQVEPSLLSEGAEAVLIEGLQVAAARPGAAAELAQVEEFAGRFPGWAQLLDRLRSEREELETTVKTLTERMAHDPQLAASLHEVISTVTAIRSTASILVDTKALEPEWQNRFHRNIDEDSQRLAEGAEALVRYLEGAPDTEAEIKSPQDELHAFLEEHAFHFPGLEGAGGAGRVEAVLARSGALETRSALSLGRAVLEQYVRDARAMPRDEIEAAVETHGLSPEAIAREMQQPMAAVFRRLAFLPEDVVGPVGLVTCDGSGTLILRKQALGFAIPRTAGACTLWPLYEGLGQIGRPVRARLRQAESMVQALAVSAEQAPAGFDEPALVHGHMLVLPDDQEVTGPGVRLVGVTCRICTLNDCRARREPSIFG